MESKQTRDFIAKLESYYKDREDVELFDNIKMINFDIDKPVISGEPFNLEIKQEWFPFQTVKFNGEEITVDYYKSDCGLNKICKN